MRLADLDSFGGVAAEEDAILQYFLSTDAVDAVRNGKALLVLGRKGTGKTAIVRYITENDGPTRARAINLRGYPWNVHAARIDKGANPAEAYVSAWQYLLAVELASLALAQPGAWRTETAQPLTNFLSENYGGIDPKLEEILQPPRIRLSKLSFAPAVLGNQLGGIELERKGNDLALGLELSALSNAIIDAAFACFRQCGNPAISLHFDELDQGISTLDEPRRALITGLILAARNLRRKASSEGIQVHPVVYLRTDLWADMQFSDKNKITQSSSFVLEWNSDSLKALVNLRLAAKISSTVQWEDITEPDRMRGSQSKWNHILGRTFLRPRDVISFLNAALEVAKRRNPDASAFTNTDISSAREIYSAYLKAELDDEMVPHWPQWTEALRACSAIGTVSFMRDQFRTEYTTRKTPTNPVSTDEALATLFQFSVVGYLTSRRGGGTAWIFQYSDPNSGFDDIASKFKVHTGLKEFAKLREDRNPSTDYFEWEPDFWEESDDPF